MMYCIIENNECSGDYKKQVLPWWSVGKTVLATAILKLVEQEKLDLQGKYFSSSASLLQVLRHEGGYGDYCYGPIYQKAVDDKEQAWTYDQMIKKTNNQNLIFNPGTNWSYSNIGYYHLKVLIEKTTDLNLEEALNKLVFSPIGIKGIKVAETKEDLNECAYVRSDYDPNWLYHGMIVGNLENACRYLESLSQGRIISNEMLLVMQDVYELDFDMASRPWKKPAYGLGLMVDNRNDEKYSYGHTGMGPDSVIAVYHFPNLKTKKTLALVMNTRDQAQVENMVHSLI